MSRDNEYNYLNPGPRQGGEGFANDGDVEGGALPRALRTPYGLRERRPSQPWQGSALSRKHSRRASEPPLSLTRLREGSETPAPRILSSTRSQSVAPLGYSSISSPERLLAVLETEEEHAAYKEEDGQNLEVIPQQNRWFKFYYSVWLCVIAVISGILLAGYQGKVYDERKISGYLVSILSGNRWEPEYDEYSKSVCASEECKRAAWVALAKMDTSVDPCDDFYNYACGQFLKDTKIPDGEYSVNTFSSIANRVQDQLLSLVGAEIHENEITPFKLAKNLYKLCMDKARIEKEGTGPLLGNLESLGGWPVLKGDAWNADSSWSWTKSMENLSMLGYSSNLFFNVSVETDWKNYNRMMIFVDQPSLGLKRKILKKGMDNPDVSVYYKSMVNMAIKMGAEKERAKPS